MLFTMPTILPWAQDKLLTMGDLYYCTDEVDFSAIPDLTATNQSAVKAILDGFNFTTVGHINNFSVSHSLQNEETISAGNCGVGELARLAQKQPTISWTWLDINNRPVFDKFLWLSLLNVAGTLVSGASQVIANPFVANQFYPITNQNGSGAIITVNSVTGGTDGALTAQDDYFLVQQNGIRGIVLNTVAWSTNITTLAQTITINYDYTPNASTLDGYNIAKETVPYVLCKFVSCPSAFNQTQGIQDTIYFWKYVLDGEMVENYVLLDENTTFEGSPISLVWVNGWGYLKNKATVAL